MLRDGSSGNVLLTAHAWGLRRRSWRLQDHNGDPVMDVHLSRMLWRFKRHGKGAPQGHGASQPKGAERVAACAGLQRCTSAC